MLNPNSYDRLHEPKVYLLRLSTTILFFSVHSCRLSSFRSCRPNSFYSLLLVNSHCLFSESFLDEIPLVWYLWFIYLPISFFLIWQILFAFKGELSKSLEMCIGVSLFMHILRVKFTEKSTYCQNNYPMRSSSKCCLDRSLGWTCSMAMFPVNSTLDCTFSLLWPLTLTEVVNHQE